MGITNKARVLPANGTAMNGFIVTVLEDHRLTSSTRVVVRLPDSTSEKPLIAVLPRTAIEPIKEPV